MTVRTAKFLFDTDFGRGEGVRPSMVSIAQHQAALAEAEARGHRAGLAAGKAQEAAETERRLAAALARAAEELAALAGGLAAVESRLEAEAVDVSVAVARKLAPALIAREPLAEVAALAADCFRHLHEAPHVVVRVNDTLYEEARDRLAAVAERCHFGGRLVVLAEPDIAAGDCRIEWADGGAKRDGAAVEAAIADAVERYLAVRGDAAPSHMRSSRI